MSGMTTMTRWWMEKRVDIFFLIFFFSTFRVEGFVFSFSFFISFSLHLICFSLLRNGTPLFYAAASNRTNTFEFLRKHNANVEQRDIGTTGLFYLRLVSCLFVCLLVCFFLLVVG
jgi:hypothetical protein